jgi:hypothetical protein
MPGRRRYQEEVEGHSLEGEVVAYAIALRTRGENGSGIPAGYWIRIVQIPLFQIRIRVFLYLGQIRVISG